MKKLTLSLVAICFSALIEQAAAACNYYIDKEQKINELSYVAIAGLDYFELLTVETVSFSYYESKTGPMCPEELTYTAQFEVTYSRNNGGKELCTALLTVQKVEPFDSPIEYDIYAVKGKTEAQCRR